MAELDYAFLADYAQIEGGKLSALGASYTHAESKGGASLWVMSVAGRVRAAVDEGPVSLSIRCVAPDALYEIAQSDDLTPGPDAKPYREKVGLLFAVTMALPIISSGLYEFFIELNGEEVRRLAFDMSLAE